jgi:hypothetical protein
MGGYWGLKGEGEGQEDPKTGETVVSATLCYTFSMEGKSAAQAQHEYLAEVNRLGYKIGLRVPAGQTVRSFVFRREGEDVRMEEEPEVQRDLAATFGAPEGEKWLGYRPHSREPHRRYHFPEPCVICYDMVLTLSPRPRLPLLVPIVIRRDNGRSFGEACISGLLVIRPGRAGKS